METRKESEKRAGQCTKETCLDVDKQIAGCAERVNDINANIFCVFVMKLLFLV